MKKIITILLIFVLSEGYGQKENFYNLLDSAKVLFKIERNFDQQELDSFNYYRIVELLNDAIKINPNNSEARYFLGYAYSRINSRDGRSMIAMNPELVIKSSEELEKVIKLSPKYNGEIVILDPYSKISAEWGSLAMSYWHNNKSDSAIWAFKEGKKRGGFGDFILELNKKVLDACSPNSILISSGDNFTIPLWYLQISQAYRTDVKVIDISLLNTKWYPNYLSKNNIIKFDLPNSVLDTMEYLSWKDSLITIGNFSWTVKPTYYEKYIFRGDRVFLSLLKQNRFEKDIFFTFGFSEDQRLNLTNHLTSSIIVDKVFTNKKPIINSEDYNNSMIQFLQLSKYLNKNSPDEIGLFEYFRYVLLLQVNEFISNHEKTKAKKLLDIMDKYANEIKFPFENEKNSKYVEYLRSKL
ncbi:MAG: hypothetical protein HXX09_14340 [Bacteroidetes bacterium]|nr:hypothetical protein [Bacteroidota bacterium]